MIYDWNRVSEEAGALYDLTDLLKKCWLGDNKIKMEQFRANWENVLCGCGAVIEEKARNALLLEQLQKSQVLKQEIAHYDRLPEGDPEKSHKFLMDRFRRYIAPRRLQWKRNATSGANGSRGLEHPAAPAKGKCKGEGKGNGQGKPASQSHKGGGKQGKGKGADR